MYAPKQAMVAKEHDGEVKPPIFFTALRGQGRF
jgi:hypothetical protein